MALITLNNRAINRSDTASADDVWTATSATATDFQAVSGGITYASQWRVSTQWNGRAVPITANWEQVDAHGDVAATAIIGSAMTQSSGVFTFPATGIWYINFASTMDDENNLINQTKARISVTMDNSNWKNGAMSQSNMPNLSYTSCNNSCNLMFDVTNTTNCKIRFEVDDDGEDAVTNLADSGDNRTYCSFIRLGDT
tara:strand:+ start:24 stop:617 length:594 start_codon:yes stop_codon:yes gene_type:complete